jgi:sugar phosphate isomerase/epimerase
MCRSYNSYISSCCSPETIKEILDGGVSFVRCGIELASSSMSVSETADLVSEANRRGLPLLAHNYFHHSEKDFVLNMASPIASERSRSIDYVCAMIDFCADNNIPEYSFHSGFACAFSVEHFGHPLTALPAFDKQSACDAFAGGVRRAAAHARSKSTGLLIENNVLTRDNLSDGKNLHLLCVSSEEIEKFFNQAACENLGLLLDFGHLKVSCKTLGLSLCAELDALKKRCGQIHLHDNDGFTDQHGALKSESEIFQNPVLIGAKHILEQPKLGVDSAARQLALLNQWWNNG